MGEIFHQRWIRRRCPAALDPAQTVCFLLHWIRRCAGLQRCVWLRRCASRAGSGGAFGSGSVDTTMIQRQALDQCRPFTCRCRREECFIIFRMLSGLSTTTGAFPCCRPRIQMLFFSIFHVTCLIHTLKSSHRRYSKSFWNVAKSFGNDAFGGTGGG